MKLGLFFFGYGEAKPGHRRKSGSDGGPLDPVAGSLWSLPGGGLKNDGLASWAHTERARYRLAGPERLTSAGR
jgi:hypothetical protein